MRYILKSEAETENFGKNFAKNVKKGDVICLSGQLGAGKTVFVRGLMDGLGYSGRVTSPTFSLMNVYEGGRLAGFHFDLYRLEGHDDLQSVGLDEYFDAGGVCVVEWPDCARGVIPREAIWIEIVSSNNACDDTRELIIHENTCN